MDARKTITERLASLYIDVAILETALVEVNKQTAWQDLSKRGIHFGADGTLDIIIEYADCLQPAHLEDVTSRGIEVRHVLKRGRLSKEIRFLEFSQSQFIKPQKAVKEGCDG